VENPKSNKNNTKNNKNINSNNNVQSNSNTNQNYIVIDEEDIPIDFKKEERDHWFQRSLTKINEEYAINLTKDTEVTSPTNANSTNSVGTSSSCESNCNHKNTSLTATPLLAPITTTEKAKSAEHRTESVKSNADEESVWSSAPFAVGFGSLSNVSNSESQFFWST